MERTERLFQAVLLCCLLPVSLCIIVKTTSGLVKGKATSEAYSYLGIPFAEPPVGNLRWRSPVKKKPWKGIYDATYLRNRCPQAPCDPRVVYGNECSDEYSEDCLHLNVFVPLRTKRRKKIPVMIFIHGGFFELGSSLSPLYDGQSFVRKGRVILVSFNYRIGALGSLWTDKNGIKGNFGIQDQRLAMKWVHQNIKKFGGNPKRVTIFGRSAGASYVGMHLVNRKADRYFKAAILMSAPFGIATKTKDQTLSIGRSFCENLNCNPTDIECLRNSPVVDVLSAQAATSRTSLSFFQGFVSWEPYMDYDEIPMNTQIGMRKGLIGKKRVIIGVTAEENAQYTYDAFPDPVPLAMYQVLVAGIMGDQTADVLQRYNPADTNDARPELRYLFDDVIFTCPSRRVAIDLSRSRPKDVYFYVYDDVLKFLKGTDINPPCQKHACHGNENGRLFQTVEKLGFTLTSAGRKLGNELTWSWTNFAKTGNPNLPKSLGKPPWPPYLVNHHGKHSLVYRRFMSPDTVNGKDFRGSMCAQFDQEDFFA